MSTLSKPSSPATGQLVKTGVLAVVAAMLANLVVRAIVGLFYEAPEGFAPLAYPSIAIFTAMGVGVGAVIYALIRRRSTRPGRTFTIVAAIAFVLSIIPNLLASLNPEMFPMPNATGTAFLVLIIFHVVAAAVAVGILAGRE